MFGVGRWCLARLSSTSGADGFPWVNARSAAANGTTVVVGNVWKCEVYQFPMIAVDEIIKPMNGFR